MIAALAVIVCGVVLYMFIEAARLPVREIVIESSEWTLEPLRIVFFADLHLPPGEGALKRLRRIVEKSNAAEPDLILLGGDYVAKRYPHQGARPEDIAAEFAKLRAPLGVYAVLGNHDNWHGAERFVRAFGAAGVPLLENKSVELKFHGKAFTLTGFPDLWTCGEPDWENVLPKNELPRIILAHSPDGYDSLTETAALALAGHTHGGQVYIPLLGSPVVPSRHGQRYVCGIVREGRTAIYVTSGIGTSILPIRFLRPPEIAVITLKLRKE